MTRYVEDLGKGLRLEFIPLASKRSPVSIGFQQAKNVDGCQRNTKAEAGLPLCICVANEYSISVSFASMQEFG